MNFQLLCVTVLLAGCAASIESGSDAALAAAPADVAAVEPATATPVRPRSEMAPHTLLPQAQTRTFGLPPSESSTTIRVLRECRNVATELVCN